jgi:immunity protein Imm5 of predicted polymorphic toxin system
VKEFDAAAWAFGFRGEITIVGELPLASRRRLISDLAAQLGDSTRGLVFRAILGLICAKRAWPVWQSRFPSESQPMALADAAVAALMAGDTGVVGAAELGPLKTGMDNKFLLGDRYFAAVAAGFAALAVVRDVLDADRSRQEEATTELETDPESWDPCFHASVAIAGGASWEKVGDPAKRRSFWEWYLASAVPDAFAQAVVRKGSEA